MNFNPRSRVGNDVSFVLLSDICGNFNPRSRVGNDRVYHKIQKTKQNFNPRSRVGNDGEMSVLSMIQDIISIHVPAWGTTMMQVILSRTILYFNPRSRVGNDNTSISTFPLIPDFNPRSRVGNDKGIHHVIYRYRYFNPRSRVGNDGIPGGEIMTPFEFQSTFPRGERRK